VFVDGVYAPELSFNTAGIVTENLARAGQHARNGARISAATPNSTATYSPRLPPHFLREKTGALIVVAGQTSGHGAAASVFSLRIRLLCEATVAAWCSPHPQLATMIEDYVCADR